MWSSYSTTKLFLLLLFLVEASLGRRYCPDPTDVMFDPIDPASLDLYRNGNVTIRWDIMNETMHTYTANVTIFNYLKNDVDIEGPWKLKWLWNHEEILFNTLGAKGTQHGSNVLFGWNGVVTVVSSQTKQIVPNCCKGGMIPSWFKEGKSSSSSSFQISVARLSSYFPPCLVSLTTPGSKYRCGTVTETSITPGYLNTWTTHCVEDPERFHKIQKFIDWW